MQNLQVLDKKIIGQFQIIYLKLRNLTFYHYLNNQLCIFLIQGKKIIRIFLE